MTLSAYLFVTATAGLLAAAAALLTRPERVRVRAAKARPAKRPHVV